MSETGGDGDRESQLYSAVRSMLEKNGEMGKLKSLVQGKVLDIVRGGEKGPITKPIKDNHNGMISILNELIMEYFHWFGYQYTVEMFATESGIDSSCPSRMQLEKNVGEKHKPDIPILLDVVSRLYEQNKH